MYYNAFTDFSKKQLDFIIKHSNSINQFKKNMLDLNENNMDDFYNTYFDSPYSEIIFEEEDFKTELVIEKNEKEYEIYLKNKFYNPKEKKKEDTTKKSKWSYRFDYELSFTMKNFIVTKNKIYKYILLFLLTFNMILCLGLLKDYNIVGKYTYEGYPANPNGSDYQAAMLCDKTGRHLVTMPHIERSVFPWQWPYYVGLRGAVTPWLEAFVNARKWIKAQNAQ